MKASAYHSPFSARQPLVLPTIALIVGMGWGSGSPLWVGVLLAGVGAIGLTLTALGKGGQTAALAASCLAFLGLGQIAGIAALLSPGPLINSILKKPATTYLVGTAGAGQTLPGGRVALPFQAEAVRDGQAWQRIDAHLNLRLPPGAQPKAGSRLAVQGFYVPNKPEEGDPLWSGYRHSLAAQGISGTLFATTKQSRWKALSEPGFSLIVQSQKAGNTLNKLLDQTLGPTPEGAVAKALLLGTRESQTPELQQTYAACGAIHLLVVSGGHLVLLWAILFWLLQRLPPHWQGQGRWAGRLVLVALLWGFAFLAGLGPSIVRAASMLTLVQIGIAFGRPALGLNALAGAVWLMLAIDPLAVHALGFQLSVGCVAGIMLFNPRLISIHTPKNPWVYAGWEAFCTTLSAQAGALPLTLVHFGQVPIWFWLANPPAVLLTVILLPGLLALLVLAGLASIGLSLAWAVKGLGWFVFYGLRGLNEWMAMVGKLPAALQEGVFITSGQAILISLACLWLATVPRGIGLRYGRLAVALGLSWCLVSVADLHKRSLARHQAIGYGPTGFYEVEQSGFQVFHSGEPSLDIRRLGFLWGGEPVKREGEGPQKADAYLIERTLLVPSRAALAPALRRRARQEGWEICDISRQSFYVVR